MDISEWNCEEIISDDSLVVHYSVVLRARSRFDALPFMLSSDLIRIGDGDFLLLLAPHLFHHAFHGLQVDDLGIPVIQRDALYFAGCFAGVYLVGIVFGTS